MDFLEDFPCKTREAGVPVLEEGKTGCGAARLSEVPLMNVCQADSRRPTAAPEAKDGQEAGWSGKTQWRLLRLMQGQFESL